MGLKCTFVIIISVLSLTICVPACKINLEHESELKMVHLLWRHGDRNPVDTYGTGSWTYPNDPYGQISFWPDGMGQLTQIGIMQHKDLGRFLRRRYKDFIKSEFDPAEVYIESSCRNRTIMSAQANLQGLFDFDYVFDGNSSLLNKTKFPIPIKVIPCKKDNKLLQEEMPCPRWTQLHDQFVANSPVIKDIMMKDRWLFDYLTNHTGKSVQTINQLFSISDVLYIQNLKNLTLPEWTKSIFPGGKMSELATFAFQELTYTDEMKKLRGGPLVEEILRHMKIVTEEHSGDRYPKLYAYSAHDHTITSILDTLRIYEPHIPYYASVLMIELRKSNISNNYYVEIFYRNDTSRDPYILHPPGCPKLCDFDTFYDLYQCRIPNNWAEDCQLKTLDLKTS